MHRPRRLSSLLLVLWLLSFTGRFDGSATAQPDARPTGAQQDNLDAQAVTLAQQVRAGGGGAVSGLQTALGQAGIAVLDADGNGLVVPLAPTQGLAFRAWELDAMLASEATGFRVSLDGAGVALSAADVLLDGQPLGAWLLDGVQQAAQGNQPSFRFWARFIAALGRQADGSNDLLTGSDPASLSIDAVQLGLLTWRLAGDLFAFGQRAEAAGTAAQDLLSHTDSEPVRLFLNALPLQQLRNTAVQPARAAAQPARPCSLGETESMILDATAVATGYGFGQLLEFLESQELAGAGAYARVTGIANLGLSYTHLGWAMAAFKADIHMVDGPPLVRTKEERPATGELRQLEAAVRMDTGDAQMVNCFRLMLNAAGLDFSLPQDGALAGAELNWEPGDGFPRGLNIADAFVEFRGNTVSQRTDERGRGTIGVEGLGQHQRLSKDAQPITKHASVLLRTVIQPANLVQDLTGAAGVASGGLLGLGAIPAEMLSRTGWGFERWYTFDVRDWQEAGYELSFDSTIQASWGPSGMQFSYHVRSVVPLGGNALSGEAPLVYVQYTQTGQNGLAACRVETRTEDSIFRVLGATVDADQGLKDTRVTIDPGMPAEFGDLVCPGAPPNGGAPSGRFVFMPNAWRRLWDMLHANEQSGSGYVITDWSEGTGSVFLRKTYQRTVVPGPGYSPATETTTLELRQRRNQSD